MTKKKKTKKKINSSISPYHNSFSKKGFAIDAYDLFILNMILVILPILYEDYDLNTLFAPMLGTSVLMGNIVGQLMFGYLGDKFGRAKMFLITCFWMPVFLIGCSLAYRVNGNVQSIYIWLIIFRFD